MRVEEFVDIMRFAIGVDKNETPMASYPVEEEDYARKIYNKLVDTHRNSKSNDHIIIYIFDHDRNAEIERYDSQIDF